MTEWAIRFPFREPDSPITDVAIDAQDLEDPEERAVVRALVLQAVLGGCATVGDLSVRLASQTPAERRPLLDSAREAAGLKSASDVEVARRSRRYSASPSRTHRAATPRASRSKAARPRTARRFRWTRGAGGSRSPIGAGGVIDIATSPSRVTMPPVDVVTIDGLFGLVEAPSVVAAMQAKDDRRREADERRRRDHRAEVEAIRKAAERY